MIPYPNQKPSMILYDIHTHHNHNHNQHSIRSIYPGEQLSSESDNHRYRSVGLHPWYITKDNLDNQIEWLQQQLKDPLTIAIGECGLDYVCETPKDLQLIAFERQIRLSETNHLPLILHVVRASHDIIRLRKQLQASQPWIIHGFRGNIKLMNDYLRHDCFISFGKYYQRDALKACPPEALFLETDTEQNYINQHYTSVANELNLSIEVLASQIRTNVRKVFFKH